jgi:hypothetical protein
MLAERRPAKDNAGLQLYFNNAPSPLIPLPSFLA